VPSVSLLSEHVTRAQLASLLARAAGELGHDVQSVTPDFPDVGGGDHAGNIGWAAEHGIINGFDDGTFGPNRSATRGQSASMFVRWLTLVE
jgi:hypothetical protein